MYLRYGIRKEGRQDSWLLGSRKEISNFSKVGWFRKPLSSFLGKRMLWGIFFFVSHYWHPHVICTCHTTVCDPDRIMCSAFMVLTHFSCLVEIWVIFSHTDLWQGWIFLCPGLLRQLRVRLFSLLPLLAFLAVLSVCFASRVNRASPFLWVLCHCLVSRLSPLLSPQFLLWPHFQVHRAVQEYPSCSLGLASLYSKALRKSFVSFFKLFMRVWGTRLSEVSVREKIPRAHAGQKSLAWWKLLLYFENRHESVIVGDPRG